MNHENRNRLLAYHHGELNPRLRRKTASHIRNCPSCRASIEEIEDVESRLRGWPEESPLPGTFARITALLPVERSESVPKTAAVPAGPIFEIMFAFSVLLGLVFFLRSRLEFLPFWESMRDFWLVRVIGSFGVSLTIFLLAGAFVSLAMAPVLYLHTHARGRSMLFPQDIK